MVDRTLLEKARLHVYRYFAKHVPGHFRYHDLEHTLNVARSAVEIGRASGLEGEALRRVELAALFHDTGFALAYEGHEKKSADLAAAWLAARGADAATIKAVRALILSTRLAAVPRGLAQRVLRDADSAKAGQADFRERGQLLRTERELHAGKPIAADEWGRENLAYLEAHRFYTRYAQERYGGQKELNLQWLRESMGQHAPGHAGKRHVAKDVFLDRELSWLSFNARVLQEAKDRSVPLLERLKFVAIHSSNLDEFYRVRVAQLRALRKLGKWNRSALEVPPGKQIDRINEAALGQQAELGTLYRQVLLPELRQHGIRFLKVGQLSRKHRELAMAYFTAQVAPLVHATVLREGQTPFIADRRIYLVLALASKRGAKKERMVLLNVPSVELGRFLVLPKLAPGTDLMYLDEVIRLGAASLFRHWHIKACHAINLSRDADLYLDEEYSDDVQVKVRRSLRKRSTGVPARFLYDKAMPKGMLEKVRRALGVKRDDMLPGGRYHHLNDLMHLPVKGRPELRDEPLPALAHPALQGADLFRALRRQDVLLHIPYHEFTPVIKLLEQAATDPATQRIAITLYRVAEKSRVCAALAKAARNGKRVDVLLEVLARFDEGNNLHWGAVLTRAGAHVVYGIPGAKVHCKLLLVERREARGPKRYAYLGTGNFNENTAKTYADMALLTANKRMADEVSAVMASLMQGSPPARTKLLVTSPHQMRSFLEQAIDREIEQAYRGRPAAIFLKLNSLEDKPLIRKLYDADRAGVEVRLIVRGICCLAPGVPGLSAHTHAISIVDRFLEHARVYRFHNGGDAHVYLASADWMQRNMDRRVEVAFPVLDAALREEVARHLEGQWADHAKARILDPGGHNRYRKARRGERRIRSQVEWYHELARAAGRGKP